MTTSERIRRATLEILLGVAYGLTVCAAGIALGALSYWIHP